MLTLIGTFLGIFARFLPEVLKFFDKKYERAHELSLLDKQIEADKLRGQMQLELIGAQAEVTLGQAEIEAIIEATKAQAVVTGVRWVDAASAIMRPLITFWWVIVLYTSAMCVQFYGLLAYGTPPVTALLTVFGADEKAIAASIISFWFVDRQLRKKSKFL